MKKGIERWNSDEDPDIKAMLQRIKVHVDTNRPQSVTQFRGNLVRDDDDRSNYGHHNRGRLSGRHLVVGAVALALIAGTSEGHHLYDNAKHTSSAIGSILSSANHLPGYVKTTAIFEDKNGQPIQDVAAFEILPKSIAPTATGNNIGVEVQLQLRATDFAKIAPKDDPLKTTYGQYMTILAASSSPALQAACLKDQADIVQTVKDHAPALVAAGADVTVAAIDQAVNSYADTANSSDKPHIYVYYDDPTLGDRTVSCTPIKK